MEFQEQKFTEARVVSEAVSSVRSAGFSGQYYRTFGGGSSSVRLCSECQVERALTSRRGAVQ